MRSRTSSTAALLLGAALAFSPTLGAQQPAGQPIAPAKRAVIVRFLELTGAAQLSLQAMETMVPVQRTANPEIPGIFWDVFLARARRDVGMLIDSLVPIYNAHFSQEQMEELVRFQESTIGQHLTKVQPLITQASMQAGQRWGAEMGRQVAESLSAAGVTFPN
ncbi:MAG: DUF2059 domain-containing protein [Gemmatimonadales bacterium]